MAAPRSTKYRRRSTQPIDVVRRFIHNLPGRSLRPAAFVLEKLLFGHFPGEPQKGLRRFARWALRDDLAATRDAFEPDFYIAQCEDPRERAFAKIDPQLHYAVIGRSRRRSPARFYDPIYYRRLCGGLSIMRDPFAHYLTIGRARGASASALDAIRRTGQSQAAETVLVIDHSRGGGSTRFIALFEAAIRAKGRGVARLKHVAGARRLALWDDLDRADDGAASQRLFDLFEDEDAFVAHARASRITQIVLSHPIDWPIEIFDWIVRVAQRIGVGFDLILHDFYFICPRVYAVDGTGRYCGLADVETCRPCIATFGSEMGGVDPAIWRAKALACIQAAEHVWTPSHDTANRIAQFVGAGRCEVWEPESDDHRPPETIPQIQSDRPLRVALLGALNVAKGSLTLLDLATEARRRSALINFVVLGPSDEAATLTAQGVKVHGRYDGPDLSRLVAEAAPDVIFLPAIWPESWSFVLSHALDLGLPVVAFDIGAPAERLRRLGRGAVLPLALASDPAGLLEALLALRRKWAAAS